MTRQHKVILTFESVHQVMAAEKILRSSQEPKIACRPVPTPSSISTSICGMAIEILDCEKKQVAIDILMASSQPPAGVFEIET